MLGDGSDSNAKIWAGRPTRLTRLARGPRNRALFRRHIGHGRPYRYGVPVPRPDAGLTARR